MKFLSVDGRRIPLLDQLYRTETAWVQRNHEETFEEVFIYREWN